MFLISLNMLFWVVMKILIGILIFKKIKWDSYTYYTNYLVENSNFWESEILDILLWWIDRDSLIYEKHVLKEELLYQTYSQFITNKIWEFFYKKKLKYSKSCKCKIDDIDNYYNKFYQRDNIIILPSDKRFKDTKLGKFELIDKYIFNYKNSKHIASIFEYTVNNLFILDCMVDLYDNYLRYFQRYKQWKYFLDDIVYWEYDNFIFYCIPQYLVSILNEIPSKFIEKYVNFRISWLEDYNFDYIDWPLIMKYGYSLSLNAKCKILENLKSIYLI